jgi:hypothetical protein
LEISPSKEMVLELLADNNQLVITGKLLSGRFIPAAESNKSRLVKLLKCLCEVHAGKEKSYFGEYYYDKLKEDKPELGSVSLEDINLAREKTDRLIPLLKEYIEYFLSIGNCKGRPYYKFRRGINDTSFMQIPEKEQIRMTELAKMELEDAVKA